MNQLFCQLVCIHTVVNIHLVLTNDLNTGRVTDWVLCGWLVFGWFFALFF